MIRTFADKRTLMVFAGESPKGFPSGILKVARRKLKMVDAAVVLADLPVPPGNQLEALSGDRKGQHSIRGQRSVAGLLRMDPGRTD
jgi:toxin HigB-1